jgi:glycosyl transferase, family 25
MPIDIYVINLDRDLDRMAFMERQLRAAGLSYERESAVNGRSLSSEEELYYADPRRQPLGHGEIGCLMSHIKVWRRIAQAHSAALILEDDVHIAAGAERLLQTPLVGADEFVVHRFETGFARVTASRANLQQVAGRRAVELFSNHSGAAAYALSPRTARQLLAVSDAFTAPPDVELFDFKRRAIHGLRVIQWIPAPFVQDRLLPNTEGKKGFASWLEDERLDIKSGVLRPQPPAGDIKSLLRPAYTGLYDMLLRPSGRARLAIPFG